MADDIEQLSDDGNAFTWVVDPNPPDKDVVAPEDLFVFVRFRALPKSRSIIESDGTYSSEFFDSQGISFIASNEQNGKGYTTTNYTNIGGAGPKEKEAFGIRDIQVEYGASLVPTVQMTFVDVRGAGLFNGYEYEDEKGLKYNSSEFASFFRLPYPLFELTVKGFYGKGVTYCLHMRNFDVTFEAKTGNFIINASFVGYTFAFLADILMKYVMAITSSEIGEEALAKQDVVSIDDFLISLGQLTRIAKDFKDTDESYAELKAINSVLAQLDKLQKTIAKPVSQLLTSVYGQPLPFPKIKVNIDQLFVRDVGLIEENQKNTHDIIVEDLEKFVIEYNDFIRKQQSTYSYFNGYKLEKFNIKTPDVAREINTATVDFITTEVLKDGITDNTNLITVDAIRTRLNLLDTSTKKFFVINYHDFRKEVDDLKSELTEKKAAQEKIVNSRLNKILGQKLGFNLSIKEIFKIILGNVEAFLEVVYNVAVDAENPNIQSDRIQDLNNVRLDINEGDQRIYPFPAAYDANTGEEIWLGDIVGENNPAFPELQLVKETINSLAAANTKRVKERRRNRGNQSVPDLGGGWVPVNPNDYGSNPYADIDSFSYDGNVVPEELAAIIAYRAAWAYDSTLYQDSRFNKFAQMEAASAVSQVKNDVIKQVIKNFNEAQFITEVLNKTVDANTKPIKPLLPDTFNEIVRNSPTGTADKGVFLGTNRGGEDDDFINAIKGQPKRNLATPVEETINTFGRRLDVVLIPLAIQGVHRELSKDGYYVIGDATDVVWNENVKSRINKFYKGRTSKGLFPSQPVNYSPVEVINDLTVFDGQLNASVDFTKPKNPDEKFTNNARTNIGVGVFRTFGVGEKCLFNQKFYTQATPTRKAYLFTLTLPMTGIGDFADILKVGGVYKFTKMQLVWIGAQFWRKTYNLDISRDLLVDIGNKAFFKAADEAEKLKLVRRLVQKTKGILPNIAPFTDAFVNQFIQYFTDWANSEYFTGSGESVEDIMVEYCTLTENGIFKESADYGAYKTVYSKVLRNLTETVEVAVTNTRAIFPFIDERLSNVKELDRSTLGSYVKQWLTSFKKSVRTENKENTNSEFNEEEELDFYIRDKDLKLATYRHFKTLYDKWIGGNSDEKVHNSCSYGVGNVRTSPLVERFHFIDRTWSWIGDTAVLNPKPIMVLLEPADINLYSFLGRVLSDSHFNFHVLPSYVNYKNISDVKDMWIPHVDVEDASSGASFICMYVGGTSKSLDLGKKSGYINDGFDLREFTKGDIPEGFKKRILPDDFEELDTEEQGKYNMVAFRVGYADQNQSIFKDMDLKQKEHRETGESLQALSDAFDNRGGTRRFYKGVNLYNVFALRSYTCGVTCLGNMQIHPMTYFQLDNIPFFHGAYMITHVKHTIKPHYIETFFKGNRMPRFVVPIVEDATSYVSIPLDDTLFKPQELGESIVRSFAADDDEFISDGEDSFSLGFGGTITDPTENELLRAQEADNSLLQCIFSGRVNNFWIQDSVTAESLDADIARVFNPNNPNSYGLKVGNCYGWTKRALKDIGVLQDRYYGIDAWTFYSGWDNAGTFYIPEADFQANLGGWTNEELAKIVPDGSFIACYYATSPSQYRATDRMISTGMDAIKTAHLRRYRDLDTKTNSCNRESFCDGTPVSKKIFSLAGYKAKHNINEFPIKNPQLVGKQLPFVPVTHSAIFINGHCFHLLKGMYTKPSSSMRIVAYYPFKDKLYQKVGGLKPPRLNAQAAVNPMQTEISQTIDPFGTLGLNKNPNTPPNLLPNPNQ